MLLRCCALLHVLGTCACCIHRPLRIAACASGLSSEPLPLPPSARPTPPLLPLPQIKAPQITKGGGLLAGAAIVPTNGGGHHGGGLVGGMFDRLDQTLGTIFGR